MRRTAVYTYRPYMHPCVLPMHWQSQTSRECIVHSVSYAIRTMFSPLCLSKQCSAADVALAPCATHYVSVLSITQRHLHLGILWTTHHVSVLCIKRRTITRGEHNIHDPRSTRDRPETDPRPARAINPTLYSPKPLGREQKKIRANNRDRHHRGLRGVMLR